MGTRSPISAIIFDLYDTLVPGGGRSTRDAVSHAMARDLGVEPEAFADAIRASFDLRARGLLGGLESTICALAEGLGGTPDDQAVRRAVTRRLELHENLLEPAAAVLAELDRLRVEGYRIGLISDCSAETPELWSRCPLADRVDAAVFSCVVRARKPDPALYRLAAADLGVDPERCVYVGDGASNELAGAVAVGMRAIKLCRPLMSRVDRADHVKVYGARPWHGPAIDGLGQLREILAAEDEIAQTPDAASTVTTSVAGIGECYTDPLWDITVHLSELERALVRSAPLRRLHFIAHAGASSITTTQTYSRLEHSLGVFALVAHFHPEHEQLRVAALLHDIGHLPFSHTLEGIAGLDHHELGARLIADQALAELFSAHGMTSSAVTSLLSGAGSVPWNPAPGLLGVDHLDSYVRSARSGARLSALPQDLLARLNLVDGAVSTDCETAAAIIDLVHGEALLHTSWENVAPSAALQHLVRQLLDAGRLEPWQLAGMTDAQVWAALDADDLTRPGAQELRLAPYAQCSAIAPDETAGADGWEFSLRKIYTSAPLIDGQPIEAAAPELARRLAELSALPIHYRVRRPE